jgi:capsid protein
MEEGAVVIGDHAVLLTRGWKLQGIEGDRICSIAPGVPDSTAWPETGKFFNGVKCDKNGRPISYSVCRRLYDSFTFEREIPAAALVMHMYTQPGRIDQWRGITPLAPSVNSFTDAYEMAFYAIQKCKQAASYGFVIKSEEFENEDKYDRDYSIDLSRGPFQKLLSPEESMEWMRAEWPAMEFQKFYREIVGLSLKSLMQPSLFFLDGEANMSEQRAKVAQWMVFIETRRDVLRTAINRIWAWRLSGFIQEGQLKLPRTKKTIDDLKWEWVAPGATSLNPVDDAKTACMELAAGITSPQRVCKARGDDAAEILREISQWDKMRIAEGVAEPMYGVVGKAIVAPDTEDDVQSSSATQSSNGGNQ